MSMAEKRRSDFRYDTGEARVPWATVGEKVNVDDLEEVIKFLIPEGDDSQAYNKQFSRVKDEIKKLWEKGSWATKLTVGGKVAELEEEVSKLLAVKYASFITNATAGFEIAHKLIGLKKGDEVIAPAITFLSTISYPLEIGAKVVLADIDPRTLNIDPNDVARKITKRTKVIIPVYIGGYPPNMDRIMEIARENNVFVLEDAAHAFGGSYKGKMSGTIGHYGSFSFHEVKNVTSLGEGGIVVTSEPEGEDFAKSRFGGFDGSNPIPLWLYDVVAVRGKGDYMAASIHCATEIQAVVLINQIKRLKQIITIRRKAAEYLSNRFEGIKGIITPPLDTADIKSTHHLYLLQVAPDKLKGDIQDLKKKLTQRGVIQIPHFAPLYKFSYMRQLGYDTKAIEKTCPNAEEAFQHRFTHLPLYPLTQEQLEYMAGAVIESVKEMQR